MSTTQEKGWPCTTHLNHLAEGGHNDLSIPERINCDEGVHNWGAIHTQGERLRAVCLCCGESRTWRRLTMGERGYALFNKDRLGRKCEIRLRRGSAR